MQINETLREKWRKIVMPRKIRDFCCCCHCKKLDFVILNLNECSRFNLLANRFDDSYKRKIDVAAEKQFQKKNFDEKYFRKTISNRFLCSFEIFVNFPRKKF